MFRQFLQDRGAIRTYNLTVDLIRDSTPQGMNGKFSIVSGVKNDALKIVSKS
jgi:hypothetical protein